MLPLRIAVAAHCFDAPLKQTLTLAAETGVEALQFNARDELRPDDFSGTARRQFLHHLEELGLEIASLHFPTRRPLYEPNRLDARLAAIKATMQFAYQMRTRVVTARIGRVPAETDSAEYLLLIELLDELARFGNQTGAVFTITPAKESVQTLSGLLSAVTAGPIGIDFDPAACVIAGHPPAEVLRNLYDRVLHIRVRDAIEDIDGSGLEVPVGRGEVEWDELLPLIDEAGYRSWLTVDRTEGDDKPGDAARAVEYLRHVAGG